MFGDKVVIWENDIGQSITFDNEDTLFVESIDMTGTAGIHTVESLAMADGQVSVAHHLSAKTIPCSFAWYGEDDDGTMRNTLAQIFSPLQSGTLTVLTKQSGYSSSQQYQIDCYPQSVPVFKRDTNLNIWRFEVDFVADYPYWRKGVEKVVTLNGASVKIDSQCPFDIAPVIYIPAKPDSIIVLLTCYRRNSSESWSTQTPAFTVAARNYALWIDVKTMRVRKASGAYADQVISVTADIDKALIRYGENLFVCTGSGGAADDPKLYYYDLSMGEV